MPAYENHGNILRCTRGTRLHYFAHRHREIEIVLMLSGASKVIVDGAPYTVAAGDALIVFPNQLHQYISTEPENYIIILAPAGIYADYADSIEGHRPQNVIIRGGAENLRVLTLAEMCLEGGTKYAYQRHKCLIGAILGILLEDLPLQSAVTNDTAVERILDYCEKHYLEPISLDGMAKDLFLGKFYISRLFGGQLGISFSNYVNALRVEEAVKLLQTTELPITDVCFASGFACTRTFNRAFIKRIGLSPRDYRANVRSEFESYVESEGKP